MIGRRTVDDLADDILRDAVRVDARRVADLDLLEHFGVLEHGVLKRLVRAGFLSAHCTRPDVR